MEAWLARLCVTHKVEIVQDYDQCKDPRSQADELTQNGWCLGMVCHWLRCKKEGIDFWKWWQTPEALSKVRFIMARQALIKLQHSAADSATKVQAALKNAGFVLKTTEYHEEERVSAANIYDSLNLMQGRYVSLCIGGEGGAHALALVIGSYQLTFFDPNAGEFVYPNKGAFRAWLPWFITGMAYSNLLLVYRMEGFM